MENKITEIVLTEEELKDMLVVTDEMFAEEQAILNTKEAKKAKEEAIENLVVKQHGVPYAADNMSQARMTSTGAIANWMFNKNIGNTLKAVADRPETDDVTKAMLTGLSDIFNGVYKEIYIDQKIGWKGADGKLHSVQGESVLEALYKSMQEVGKVIQETSMEDK